MPTRTFPFDAARDVQTPEGQTAYLDEALAGGDAAESLDALATVARPKGIAENHTATPVATGEGASLSCRSSGSWRDSA